MDRLFRQVIRPVMPADEIADFAQGAVGHTRRIGSHIRDQPDRAFAAQFLAFIQLLGNLHGPLRRKAQFARSLLLQL